MIAYRPDMIKSFIDDNSYYGDLEGSFLPLFRVYLALNGCTEVRNVNYNCWDIDEFAYVSFSCADTITVAHHKGIYRVFDGRVDTNIVLDWHYDVGKNKCILESEYGCGIYDFLVKIDKWLNYKCVRRQFGLSNDNFDCVFKGFGAFCESLVEEAESCR